MKMRHKELNFTGEFVVPFRFNIIIEITGLTVQMV